MDEARVAAGGRRRWLGALQVAAGLALTVAHVLLKRRLPRGPGEFAYPEHAPAPLPFAAMRGLTSEQLALLGLRAALLGPGLLLLILAVARGIRRAPVLILASRRTAGLVGLLSIVLASCARCSSFAVGRWSTTS